MKTSVKKQNFNGSYTFFLISISVALFLTLTPTVSHSANYPLEITQPQAGLDTTNRFYKAYPGLEYNIRLAVISGSYPYVHELTTAPTGMTIDATTGEIQWDNPTTSGSPHSVTAKVTDSDSSTDTGSWTITVTTDGFYFLDAVNGILCR